MVGVVDSGADMTSLPVGFASLMGYTGSMLASETRGTAGGQTSVLVAQVPVTAYVVGLPSLAFELYPDFLPASSMVLWGRRDFFRMFDIRFDERAQQLHLIR